MAKQLSATAARIRPGLVQARQADFAQFILDKGAQVHWEEAVRCPCAALTPTRAPDPSHELCNRNYGMLYYPKRTIRVLVTSQDWKKAFDMGYPSTGGLTSFSFPNYRADKATREESIGQPSYPAFGDRITFFEELVCISDEVFIKGQLDENGHSMEVTRFRTVSELLCVRGTDLIFNPKVDVRITTDRWGDQRRIEWVPGHSAPATDEPYTVRYLTPPEFLIRDVEPRFRRGKEGPLPPFVRAVRIDQVKP